jgi:hypothetical protein
MTNVILMFGAILMVGVIIAVLDRRAQRKERESESRRSA